MKSRRVASMASEDFVENLHYDLSIPVIVDIWTAESVRGVCRDGP
jgi:hypothetical protein